MQTESDYEGGDDGEEDESEGSEDQEEAVDETLLSLSEGHGPLFGSAPSLNWNQCLLL